MKLKLEINLIESPEHEGFFVATVIDAVVTTTAYARTENRAVAFLLAKLSEAMLADDRKEQNELT